MQSQDRLHEILHQSAIQILKNELEKAKRQIPRLEEAVPQLEQDYINLARALKRNEEQMKILDQQSNEALERIRVAYEELDQQKFRLLASIATPPPIVAEVAHSFCKMIFEGQEVDWQQFQELAHMYLEIKKVMHNFQPEPVLTESLRSAMLPLWKNYQAKSAELQKICPTAQYMLDWVNWSMEYKLRKEALHTTEEQLPEIRQKLKALYDDMQQTAKALEQEKEHKITVTKDLETEQQKQAKKEHKQSLAQKYQLDQKYQLVRDKAPGSKKIVLKAINRNKKPRMSFLTAGDSSKYQSYFENTRFRQSQISSFGGTVADEAGSVRDDMTSAYRSSSAMGGIEQDGTVNYGREEQEVKSFGKESSSVWNEVQSNIIGPQEDKRALDFRKNMSASSKQTPQFNSTQDSVKSWFSQENRTNDRTRFEERKTPPRKNYVGRTSNSTTWNSGSRRASMSQMKRQQSSSRRDSGADTTRYSGISSNEPTVSKWTWLHKRGQSVPGVRRSGVKYEAEEKAPGEAQCCSGGGWRKFFCF